MARRFSHSRIKTHRVYSVSEVAGALGAHRQTVIRWIKSGDLTADTTTRPWIIAGSDLKQFLGHKSRARKCQLALWQLYCFRCHGPREPAGKMAEFTLETATVGNLAALCPDCFAVMNRKLRRSDLEAVRSRIEVTVTQAAPTLVSREDPPDNVTYETEAKPHVKAH